MITLPLVKDGHATSDMSLNLSDLGKRNFQISVSAGPLQGQSFQDWDYFSALTKLRVELEKEGLLLGCVGSLRNFYPSSMALDMGQGKVGYFMTLGEKAGRKSMARTFDRVDEFSGLATVEEQVSFFQAWRNSLKS